MHAWEGRPFDDIATLCTRRDPRRYPIGCVTGRPGENAPEVLQWFRTVGEMAAFLWRMEPQRWGLRLRELAEFKTRTEAALIPLDIEGTHEALRETHNQVSRPHFEIVWWGSFDNLRAGRGGWAEAALARYRGRPRDASEPVANNELDNFVSYLREGPQVPPA